MGSNLKSILDKLGIVRISLGKDLVFFFLPFVSFILIGLFLCQSHGDGVTDIWETLFGMIVHPKSIIEYPWNRIVGLFQFVFGLTIMIVSQITLWKNYSGFVVIKKEHVLITHGIYRFTRNPIYLGAIIGLVGLPMYSASLYGIFTMLFLIPIFINRIRYEEKILVEEFKDDYQKYKDTTKKLIPFIY